MADQAFHLPAEPGHLALQHEVFPVEAGPLEAALQELTIWSTGRA
jgi:hypothetical protein